MNSNRNDARAMLVDMLSDLGEPVEFDDTGSHQVLGGERVSDDEFFQIATGRTVPPPAPADDPLSVLARLEERLGA